MIKGNREPRPVDARRREHDIKLWIWHAGTGGPIGAATIAIDGKILALLLDDRIEMFHLAIKAGTPREKFDLSYQGHRYQPQSFPAASAKRDTRYHRPALASMPEIRLA